MPELSNSNLFGNGSIQLKPDYIASVLKLEIHFVTIHLQPKEVLQLIVTLMFYGIKLWGSAWGNGVLNSIGKIEEPNISIPTGGQVTAMGEDI